MTQSEGKTRVLSHHFPPVLSHVFFFLCLEENMNLYQLTLQEVFSKGLVIVLLCSVFL